MLGMMSREYHLTKMAHLPEDKLPGEFDVVIDGTGALECDVSACLRYGS